MKTGITNGRIITPNEEFLGSIIIEDGNIIKIGRDIEPVEVEEIIDAKGQYISPGFIDLHTHGGGDHDFMDGSVEAFQKAALKHMEHGTTTLMPTTLTSTMDGLMKTIEVFEKAKKLHDIPELYGLHLEGPYFSYEQRGAQDPRYLKNPDKEEYLRVLSSTDSIKRWSVAPELEGALEMGLELRKRGIIPSIGHSNAIYEEVVKAVDSGYSLLTHFYSGMSGVRRINAYRYAGVIESGYLLDDLFVEIIADGHHLPSSLLKLIYKIKGPDRICLVTDSMRAAGMGDGVSYLGTKDKGQKVIVEDGVAKLMDRSAFAGSVATADQLIRTMRVMAEVPLKDAVKMMTLTPAKVMGMDHRKGSLVVGKEADILIFDKDINIKLVMTKGKVQINKLQKN